MLVVLLGSLVSVRPSMAQEKPVLKVTRAVSPIYPDIGRSIGLAGTVLIRVTIDSNGRVVKAEKDDGDKILFNAAVVAARRWEFERSPEVPERHILLTFSFVIVPKDSERSERTAVFLPPYGVEVRSIVESAISSPNVDPKLPRLRPN